MKREIKRGVGVVAVVAAMATAGPARAQATGADAAAAVTLFNEAQKLVAAGDYAAACPKFAEVRRTLPTAGLFLNLGDCYEHTGKLASAWGAYKEAEIISRNNRDADRLAEATKRSRALEGRLPRLTITVGPAERVPGLRIKRDATPIGEAQWGSAMPVDAGEHKVEVAAPGHRTWLTTVSVGADGAAMSVAVPRLAEDVVLVAPPAGPPPWWTGQRAAGVAMSGAGAVGVVVGAVLGAMAMGKNADSKAQCSPSDPTFCNDHGVALRNDAKAAGTGSTAAFVVGGVLAAGGVVLIVTAPKEKAKEGAGAGFEMGPRVGGGEVGLVIGGRW